MHRLVSGLIIYRDLGKDSILLSLSDICKRFFDEVYVKEQIISDIYEEIHKLLDVSTRYGFDKNLWHNYLSYLLLTLENPFTLVSEKHKPLSGSVSGFAKNDFDIFLKLFNYDFSVIEDKLGINCFSVISDYKAIMKSEQIYNKNVSDNVKALSIAIENAKNADEVYEVVTYAYQETGIGDFGLNKAFRLNDNYPENNPNLLIPITSLSSVTLDDLIGYDIQKKKLIENTESFVMGREANNCLLYGDAGTGKSTSIKAILNMYYPKGLRMIEVYKHQFKHLNAIISLIKNRNYKFIIFMDDLSFEEFETEYKYLKAVIEGGLETKPQNVLIYATSNRRHLIKEMWSDRSDMSDDELHRSDTMQEKISLAARFGVTIGYYKPNQKEYYEIVKGIAKNYDNINCSEEELLSEAHKWELNHGGMSGRAAQQFISHISGIKK